MSNENAGGIKSMFSSFGSKSDDPDLNIPVTGGGGFMNYDPRILQQIQSEDQYIMPEGASHKRGRFEKAFAQIGGSCMIGAAFGGTRGVVDGWQATQQLAGAVKRTQMLNYITKQGASSAQTLGVVALMYSIFGVVLSLTRGTDDELNTLIAGTSTGLLFKSSTGMNKCLRGGAFGFTAAALYCLFTSPKVRDMMHK